MADTAAPASPAPAVTGVDAAAARIRETAKWLTVSLASVAAVMLGGSQLSDIGKLASGSDRLYAAIAAAAVAAAATAVVLAATITIAATPTTSFNDMLKPEGGLGNKKWATPTLADRSLTDNKEPQALQQSYMAALAAREKAQAEAAPIPPNDPEATAAYDAVSQADAHVVYLNTVIDRLMATLAYHRLAHRWRIAGVVIIVCGIIAAGAIGVFAWASHPPADATASVVTPAVLTAPKAATITLTAAGRDALAGGLGHDCDVTAPLTGLVLGKTDAGPDVVIQQDRCAAARFIAVPSWAVVTSKP